MTSPIKALVFAGSNSAKSINLRLAVHAANVLRDSVAGGVAQEILDLNAYEMPIYSPEREAVGIPPQAQAFLDKIAGADALIVSMAEHNGTFSAAFKNIFDWCSRVERAVFQQKPMLLMATSPGQGGGKRVHDVAMSSFPHFGGNIAAGFQFGPFGEHFDLEAGKLVTDDKVAELAAAVGALKNAIEEKPAA